MFVVAFCLDWCCFQGECGCLSAATSPPYTDEQICGGICATSSPQRTWCLDYIWRRRHLWEPQVPEAENIRPKRLCPFGWHHKPLWSKYRTDMHGLLFNLWYQTWQQRETNKKFQTYEWQLRVTSYLEAGFSFKQTSHSRPSPTWSVSPALLLGYRIPEHTQYCVSLLCRQSWVGRVWDCKWHSNRDALGACERSWPTKGYFLGESV